MNLLNLNVKRILRKKYVIVDKQNYIKNVDNNILVSVKLNVKKNNIVFINVLKIVILVHVVINVKKLIFNVNVNNYLLL